MKKRINEFIIKNYNISKINYEIIYYVNEHNHIFFNSFKKSVLIYIIILTKVPNLKTHINILRNYVFQKIIEYEEIINKSISIEFYRFKDFNFKSKINNSIIKAINIILKNLKNKKNIRKEIKLIL